jgi:hypothetical protein
MSGREAKEPSWLCDGNQKAAVGQVKADKQIRLTSLLSCLWGFNVICARRLGLTLCRKATMLSSVSSRQDHLSRRSIKLNASCTGYFH